jgi:hypothetical protein
MPRRSQAEPRERHQQGHLHGFAAERYPRSIAPTSRLHRETGDAMLAVTSAAWRTARLAVLRKQAHHRRPGQIEADPIESLGIIKNDRSAREDAASAPP